VPPREFYERHLLPAYNDWSLAGEEWRFRLAAINVSHMADHVFAFFNTSGQLHVIGSPSGPRVYRDQLRSECHEFGLIWDVADGHKHVLLDRKSAQVSRDEQVGFRRAGGAFSSGFSSAYDRPGEKVMIDLNNGTAKPGAPVLKRAQLMWKWKLESWGML
jgi:hypothetical protein